MRVIITLMVMACVLAGCGASESASREVQPSALPASVEDDEVATSSDDDDREPFDEDTAREEAGEEVAAAGYSGPCTSDCSGHDAGFAWATEGHEDRGISSSQSFDEGQEAFERAVEEHVDEAREAYDGEEEN